jgi:hypothetical protein
MITWIEQFAIALFPAILAKVVKNPSHYAAIVADLKRVAADINAAFPDTPPAQSTPN